MPDTTTISGKQRDALYQLVRDHLGGRRAPGLAGALHSHWPYECLFRQRPMVIV
jgi:hypothetical protein